MPLYIKKSVSIGPFRFNLSKSGIGLSAGLTGLRFGAGPRGTYVHAGREGIYYRKTISSKPTGLLFKWNSHSAASLDSTPHSSSSIDSALLVHLSDTAAAELVGELNQKQSFFPKKLIALAGTIVALLVSYYLVLPVVVLAGIAVVGLALTIYLVSQDEINRCVLMLYDFDSELQQVYGRILDVFDEMSKVSNIWHIEVKDVVSDSKYQGSASEIVRRHSITLSQALPPFVKSNIDPPSFPVGKQRLFFLPDWLLICEDNSFGAIGYSDLKIEITELRFLEQQPISSDTTVIGRTWRYVNKDGGPDRRFKNNAEVPIVIYEQIRFFSDSGLNELIMLSKCGLGEQFRDSLKELATLQTGPDSK